MKVTVIGAGNCSCAMAADLSDKGLEVTMLIDEEHEYDIQMIADSGSIILYENDVVKDVSIDCITTDPEKGLKDSEVVFFPIPAYGQKPLLEKYLEYCSDGQILLFTPGYLGSVVARKIIRNRSLCKRLYIGETNETIYNAAKVGGRGVRITGRIELLFLAAFPMTDVDYIKEKCEGIYNFTDAKNVFHCILNATNPIYHVPGCILNAGRIERAKGQFYLYEEGLTPAVCYVMERLDEERVSISKALGYPSYTVIEELAEGREPRTMWEEINGCQALEFVRGPETLASRYLTEDIPYGIATWLAIGEEVGLNLPIMQSLKVLGGTLLEGTGICMRDAEELGLQDLNIQDL